MKAKKLGVNIDHVATLRQARGGTVPSPRLAALEAQKGGADGITIHLREDRRHIQDSDVREIQKSIRISLNLEMSLHPEIVKIALKTCPDKVCIVPERRRELTTEGGLDAVSNLKKLQRVVPGLREKKVEVSLFIAPDSEQIWAAKSAGADAIEIHTGSYANAKGRGRERELGRIRRASREASALGLKVNAGHGLDYQNVGPIVRIPEIEELNIGHSIISRSVFVGLREAVRQMKRRIR